jgi:transmembrane sensor
LKNSSDINPTPREQAMDWLLRLEAAPDDKALEDEFNTWLGHRQNQEAFAEMKRVWSGLDHFAAVQRGERAAPHPGPVHRQSPATIRRSGRFGRLRRYSAMAALALIAVAAFTFYPALLVRLEADALTGTAETRAMTFEDGSVAQLDAKSAVAVNYTADRREVLLLTGNAFFEVVPSTERPFVVRAADVTVTVVGTAFAVRTSLQLVSVSVQSGTVRVASGVGDTPATTLTRGQRITIDRDLRRMSRSEVSPDDVASWRQGRLVVHDVPLSAVVDEVGRYYDGIIVFQDSGMARRLVTGVFDLRRPLDALASAVDTQNGRVLQVTPYFVLVSRK